MLYTIYKSYATILAIRIKRRMPKVIHAGQSGFKEDRCIFENVVMY